MTTQYTLADYNNELLIGLLRSCNRLNAGIANVLADKYVEYDLVPNFGEVIAYIAKIAEFHELNTDKILKAFSQTIELIGEMEEQLYDDSDIPDDDGWERVEGC